jgi:FkbM family methyltransferase
MNIKALVKNTLARLYYKSNIVNNLTVATALPMSAAFQRMIGRGMLVNTIIDVGGSDGRWSLETLQHFPKASFYLIEANPIHENKLLKLKNENHHIDYRIAAGGSEVGKIYFDNSSPFGGKASQNKTGSKQVEVDCTTIDHEVMDKKLKPPYGIKLDTHGFEVPILEGAVDTLKSTEFLVIETYNFKLSAKECLRFPEMCLYMEKMGFRVIDIAEPLFRPYDKSLWQLDLFFVRADRKEFQTLQFS